MPSCIQWSWGHMTLTMASNQLTTPHGALPGLYYGTRVAKSGGCACSLHVLLTEVCQSCRPDSLEGTGLSWDRSGAVRSDVQRLGVGNQSSLHVYTSFLPLEGAIGGG